MARLPALSRQDMSWVARIVQAILRKRYGVVLDPIALWSYSPSLLMAFLFFFSRLTRKGSPLDPLLRALVCVRVSQINACAFCIDMNAFLYLSRRQTPTAAESDKLFGVADYETRSDFSALERAVLRYVDQMTLTNGQVPEDTFATLRLHLDNHSIVELTALVGFQNLSSRFNTALGAQSSRLCKR